MKITAEQIKKAALWLNDRFPGVTVYEGHPLWVIGRVLEEAAKIAGHKNAKGMDEIKYVRFDLHEALKAENERLREAVRDLAECVSVQLELSRLKENNPNLYNPFLDKHAETISKCGGEK